MHESTHSTTMIYPQAYDKVAQSEDGTGSLIHSHYYKRQTKPQFRGVLLAALAATITFILGYGVASSSGSPFDLGHSSLSGGAPAVLGPFVDSSQCGNSTTEARALGCTYDLLSTTWWPAACQDQSTSKEFEEWLRSPQRIRPWPFFHDKEGTQPILTLEDLAESAGTDIWTTQEFHTGHCMLWWKRLHKSMEGRIATNIWSGEYHHTAHCTSVLLSTDWSRIGEIYARLPAGGGFGWCRQPISDGDLKT